MKNNYGFIVKNKIKNTYKDNIELDTDFLKKIKELCRKKILLGKNSNNKDNSVIKIRTLAPDEQQSKIFKYSHIYVYTDCLKFSRAMGEKIQDYNEFLYKCITNSLNNNELVHIKVYMHDSIDTINKEKIKQIYKKYSCDQYIYFDIDHRKRLKIEGNFNNLDNIMSFLNEISNIS